MSIKTNYRLNFTVFSVDFEAGSWNLSLLTLQSMCMRQRHYKGAIWTNHALERLGQRGLTQSLAGETFQNPDQKFPAKNGGTEFQKKFGISTVTVIAKKNDSGEWLILSNWIDPPMPGTQDAVKKERYHSYQKASFWGKVWIQLKSQFLGQKF